MVQSVTVEPDTHSDFDLSLGVEPSRWPAESWTDVALEVTLSNHGEQKRVIYPKIARWHTVARGGGPIWIVQAKMAQDARQPVVSHLRTTYDDPPEPPPRCFFLAKRVAVAPGESLSHRFRACWVPRATLKRRHLSYEALNPEGRDPLAPAQVEGASVLALDRGCEYLRRIAEERDDFLRSGVNVFVPAGQLLHIRMAYAHSPWAELEPRETITAGSPWVPVELNGPDRSR